MKEKYINMLTKEYGFTLSQATKMFETIDNSPYKEYGITIEEAVKDICKIVIN